MIRKNDIPKMFIAGLKVMFQEGRKAYTPLYPQLTTEMPSDGSQEDYGWLGQTPGLTEWKDERAPKGLLDYGFALKNKDYESSMSVHRNTIKDEKYGQVSIRAKGMGTQASKGYDKHLATAIEAGSSTECYDGQNFFDTGHIDGTQAAQKNYRSGTALTIANAQSVIAEMEKYVDDQGELAGVMATHIMVPTALQWKAAEIFKPKGNGESNANNVLADRLEIIKNPFLTSSTTWYILDLSQAVKPFIYQNRQELEYDELTDSTENFMRKEIFFGVDARFAFGYSDWRYAYMCEA